MRGLYDLINFQLFLLLQTVMFENFVLFAGMNAHLFVLLHQVKLHNA